MSISTHILDTALGRPAAGVRVSLEQQQAGTWQLLHATTTDADGRCRPLLPPGVPLAATIYRIHFVTAPYFAAQGIVPLYPFVEITFTVADPTQHFHIPLLLTANGYTTYRGS